MAALTILAACNNNSTTNTATDSSNVYRGADTVMNTPTPPMDSTTLLKPRVSAEGDIMMKNGKIMVYKKSNWENMNGGITLSNGGKISTTGDYTQKGRKWKLKEGYTISTNGEIMDNQGKIMDSNVIWNGNNNMSNDNINSNNMQRRTDSIK